MNDERAHDALALAERALAFADAAGATEAEALVMAEDAALTRFANSQIHQNVAETNVVVNLRFVVGKRVGVASSGRTDDEGLRRSPSDAAAIAGVVEELAGLGRPARADAGRAEVAAAYAPATADGLPRASRRWRPRGHRRGRRRRCHRLSARSRPGTETMAVANSKGIRVGGTRTVAQLLTVSMGPGGGTGYAEQAAVDATTIDAAAIGRESADKARATADAIAIEAGDYPVVLEEYAVVDLLDMLGYLGLLGARRPGGALLRRDRQARSAATSSRSSTTGAIRPACRWRSTTRASPSSGSRCSKRGICGGVVYDAQTAARDGVTSTGHGLPAPNTYGPFPLNQVMTAGRRPRDELIAGLDRGLLVTRFHYTNPVHPKLAIVTGMTRDGTFLVEDGKDRRRRSGTCATPRATSTRWPASCAVARERKTLKGFLGGVVVPAVRIDSWTFTGTTEH